MSTKTLLLGVSGASAVLMAVFGSVALYNAAQPPAPMASGATIGGISLGQWGNIGGFIASLGGTLIPLIIAAFTRANPNLAPVIEMATKLVRSDIGDAVVTTVPAIISNIDADPSNDKPVDFKVTRKLTRGTLQLSVLWTPETTPKV